MISPLPFFWWLVIGLIAESVYPLTKLNIDNVSVTSLQFGLVIAFILSMLAMWLSFLFEDKANDSKLLNFIFFSSRQFADLAMGVAGFSAAYFLLHNVFLLPSILFVSSIVLATSLNHIYLVVFNQSNVGTYNWALSLDERNDTKWNSTGVKVISGLLALLSMVLVGCYVIGWLKA